MGLSVAGIFQELSSFDDINSTSLASDDKILATGDNYGKVKIFSYPLTTLGASFKVNNRKHFAKKNHCEIL